MKSFCFSLIAVLLLNVFCISSLASDADSAALTCDGKVLCGETLTVMVTLDTAEKVSAIAVEPVFNTDTFTLEGGKWRISGALANFDAAEGNGVLAFSSPSFISGIVLSFELGAKKDATLNDYAIGCNVVLICEDGTRVNVTVVPTFVSVKCKHSYGYDGIICTLCGEERDVEIVKGDVNFDGFVDNLDAVLILQHVVDIIDFSDKALVAADADGDGSIDTLDALIILKYDVGLIESF